MSRGLILVYSVVAYLAFFAVILYAIGFVGDFVVPKAIDDGTVGPIGAAIAINVGLLAVFAVQHTIMARPAFKKWWTRIIPAAAERATFVLAADAALALVFWQWRPMPETVWSVEQPIAVGVLNAIYFLGWGIVFYSSFLIDHFDLFGLRQAWLHAKSKPYAHHPFQVRSLYRLVRHPLMSGFLIMAWVGPVMSQGRLLFAIVITAYIVVAVKVFEERDLVRFHGDAYRDYQRSTPMLFPIPGRKRPSDPDNTG